MARPQNREYLLRVIRETQGISKESVSEKAGVDVSNIWRAEVGKILSEDLAFKISEALGVDPDIVFYNMGRIPPSKRDFLMNDPLLFKELIDKTCADPSKHTKTKDYIESLKSKMRAISPDVNNLLSQIKPTK